MISTFDRLHPGVQRFIFNEKWTNFKPIQDRAIEVLLGSNDHLLICAATASGKTEAAFLPIVSEIAEDYMGSFRAVYVSPLKALINDQFMRIDKMCQGIGIPVTKWHGDASQSLKQAAQGNPGGILLITPESLEAIVLRKGPIARAMFQRLKWIVIDEIHSYIGSERGAQLRSLISRIENDASITTTKIGLSATIGNPDKVAEWMTTNGHVVIIDDRDGFESDLQGMIYSFVSPHSKNDLEDDDAKTTEVIANAVLQSFDNGKNLIFGNSKRKLEELCVAVSKQAKKTQSPASFLIHHGSLSKETRENAEHEVKLSSRATSVFCTSTLEMGIDIGAIEKIGLIDPPWSVSSFAQRIGRSGRRTGSNRHFEFFIQHAKLNEDSNLSERLREDLIKSTAVVLLYIEGFKEPLDTRTKNFSTLVHQILSYSAQRSGVDIESIYNEIVVDSFRSAITREQFLSLTENLIEKKILFRTSDATILPGQVGERLTDHYEFFSVFKTSENWIVVCNGSEIGSIPTVLLYKTGDRLLLSGRLWSVVEVNDDSHRLTVIPAKSGKAPIFGAVHGITHKQIHEKMKAVYESTKDYPFLDQTSSELLAEARREYKMLITPPTPSKLILPIFEGTKVQTTVRLALETLKVDFGLTECFIQFSSAATNWKSELNKCMNEFTDPLVFASKLKRSNKIVEKYDSLLTDDLLNITYADTNLDLEGAIAWVKKSIS